MYGISKTIEFCQSFNFENILFMSSVEKTVVRLKRDLPCDIDHYDDGEEEEKNQDDEDSDN